MQAGDVHKSNVLQCVDWYPDSHCYREIFCHYPSHTEQTDDNSLPLESSSHLHLDICSSNRSTFNLYIYNSCNSKGTVYCLALGNFDYYAKIYETMTFVFLFLVPLLIMSVIYTRISIVLWKTSKPDGLTRNTVGGKRDTHNSRAFFKPSKGKLVSFSKTVVRLEDTRYEPIGSVNGRNNYNSSSDETKKKDIKITKDQLPTSSEDDQSNTYGDDPSDDILDAADYENDWPTARRGLPEGIKLHWKTIQSKPDLVNTELGNNSNWVSSATANRNNGRVITPKASGRKQNALTARRKVVRLLIAVVIAFTLCLLPYHIHAMKHYWSKYYPEPTYSTYLINILITLPLYLQNALNPILYAFLSENFRKSLHEMLCCRHRRGRHQRSVRSMTSLRTANTTL